MKDRRGKNYKKEKMNEGGRNKRETKDKRRKKIKITLVR